MGIAPRVLEAEAASAGDPTPLHVSMGIAAKRWAPIGREHGREHGHIWHAFEP